MDSQEVGCGLGLNSSSSG